MTCTVAEAIATVLREVEPLGIEELPLMSCAGRVLARPERSPVNIPLWDNSAMDGFAVRSDDIRGATASAPVELRVIERIAAGAFPSRGLSAGSATQVMTGAPVPPGADGVVRVEDTESHGDTVRIIHDRDYGRNIRRVGEDIRKGEEVLTAGTELGPAQLGVLASIGMAAPAVYRRPKVAIVASGDELVTLEHFDQVLAGKRIVSSNSYTLQALVSGAGGVPAAAAICSDTLADMESTLSALRDCDAIVTTAGVSVGEHDHVRTAVETLGGRLEFWRVRMRPGAQFAFGWLHGVPFLALPGNPVSTMVTFEIFVRPLIRKLLGHRLLHRRTLRAELEEDITAPVINAAAFLRAVMTLRQDGTFTVRLTGAQGSGMLTSMARANALVVLPDGAPSAARGEVVTVLPLGDQGDFTSRFEL